MFRIITIPFNSTIRGFDEDVLNKFLLNKQLNIYKVHFFQSGSEAFWTVFMEYDPLLEQLPNKPIETLDNTGKQLFEKLRLWRKETAENKGIPPYVICTNQELNAIVRAAPRSLEALKNIPGIGNAKAAKYGQEMLAIIKGFYETT